MKYTFILAFVVFFCSCKQNMNTEKKKEEKEQQYKLGKKLFSKHCGECHNKNMIHDMTAPPLGYALDKRDSMWFVGHTKKGTYPIDSTDQIALGLRQKGWALMPSFDYLKDEEIENIIFFIRQEFEKNKN